jgi:hypothetical protein
MRKRPWTIAVLTSTCLLLLLATNFPLISGLLGTPPALLASPAAAKVLQIGGDDTAASDGLSDSPSVTTLDTRTVRGVLGSAVRSVADEDMGRIVDVIVDRNGDARAAVIDFGGFLGVGSRKIAVDWGAIRFGGVDHVTLDMTRDQVKAAPEYQAASKSIVVLGASPEFARARVTERIPER